TSDGFTRLQELSGEGGFDAVLQEKAISPGVASATVYQGGGSAFMMLSHGSSAWAFEINRTGFRDDARQQRILNSGQELVNIDVANSLFRPAPGGNRPGFFFNMGHRLILT